jgi:deoxyribonuclease-4
LDPVQVERFRQGREEAKIFPLAIHASYLINLATTDDYLVVHVGSNAKEGLRLGITRVVEALKRIKTISLGTQLLLENTAGERGDIGSRMEELAEILSRLGNDPPVDLCLDTCHAFAAGYEISHRKGVENWVSEIESTVGFSRVKLLHVNDSKKDLGCRVDRHEHIGQGKIGLEGFKAIVRHPKLRKIPMILETPKEREGDDRRNMNILLKLSAKS